MQGEDRIKMITYKGSTVASASIIPSSITNSNLSYLLLNQSSIPNAPSSGIWFI